VIGLFIKIPFHSQIRSSEPRLAAELQEAVDEAVTTFAASRCATEESFLLGFDESSRPCRLRAAEAARSLSLRLGAMAPRLHGWALLLDAGAANPEDCLLAAKRLWYGMQGDGFQVSLRSAAFFSDYFSLGTAGPEEPLEGRASLPVLDAIYARPALPLRDAIDESTGLAQDRIASALGSLAEGAALAVLGPGAVPLLGLEAALTRLFQDSSPRFLRLSASTVERSPYGPLAGAFASLLASSGAGPDSELSPMLDFLLRSPYRRGCSEQFRIRLRLCVAAALRLYARRMRALGLPPLVLLDRIESFPEPSLALMLGLADEIGADEIGAEGITIIASGSKLPPSWTGPIPRCIDVAGPDHEAMARAAVRCAEAIGAPEAASALALSAAGEPLRLRLALRILASGHRIQASASLESLAAQALASLPREFAELLLALRLGEENLTDESMESFLSDSGYIPGVRTPIYESLAELGLIWRGRRPRIVSSAAAMGAEHALEDGGAAIRGDFSARLLLLRERGLIIPSAALFRRMSGGARDPADGESCALALDCISADILYGPSESGEAEPLASPLAPMADFLRSFERADRGGSLAALERLESSGSSLGASADLVGWVASLARAAFDYAEGRAQIAATEAKKALMGLHSLGLRKAESRAHRILGLCSLALEQVQEGSDYLANAYEIAASLPEPLECILSAAAEAAAHFSLGDLGKAASRAVTASTWARSCFRADWEAACAFIEGRTALETGRCAAAEECFERVKALARIYGQTEAARRAEIWNGRAAAFAGDRSRARSILLRFDEDAEALWFRGELEAWEGDFAAAALLADKALALAPGPGFFPSDIFDWSSGSASLEGRAAGFFARRSYLVDQIAAFHEYAKGMAKPEEEGLASAARLTALAREDRLAAIHPSAHLYLFYRFLILERVTPNSMDGAGAISKAFKALQLRSTRMGEASLKADFLEANRWNRALIDAARSRKLI
jgi:hypothetical protein